MSFIDEDIRLAGRPATIIRDAGNISTYATAESTGQDAGRRRLDPNFGFDYTFKFMTDSGIASGDLVVINSEYYLVITLEPKYVFGDLEYYRGTLYKCNSVVSIYYLNNTTKKYDTLHKADVQCLIAPVRAREWDEDKAIIMPNRGYRGQTQPFQVLARSSDGILTEGCIIKDASDRRFRVNKESNPFLSDGVFLSEIEWENA